jgi:hypothetical protein
MPRSFAALMRSLSTGAPSIMMEVQSAWTAAESSRAAATCLGTDWRSTAPQVLILPFQVWGQRSIHHIGVLRVIRRVAFPALPLPHPCTAPHRQTHSVRVLSMQSVRGTGFPCRTMLVGKRALDGSSAHAAGAASAVGGCPHTRSRSLSRDAATAIHGSCQHGCGKTRRMDHPSGPRQKQRGFTTVTCAKHALLVLFVTVPR